MIEQLTKEDVQIACVSKINEEYYDFQDPNNPKLKTLNRIIAKFDVKTSIRENSHMYNKLDKARKTILQNMEELKRYSESKLERSMQSTDTETCYISVQEEDLIHNIIDEIENNQKYFEHILNEEIED